MKEEKKKRGVERESGKEGERDRKRERGEGEQRRGERERWIKCSHLSSMIQQQSCHIHMAIHRGLHQGSVHLIRLVLLVSS